MQFESVLFCAQSKIWRLLKFQALMQLLGHGMEYSQIVFSLVGQVSVCSFMYFILLYVI